MPKAAQVLAALRRDGWVQIRQRGSHRRLVKGPLKRTWAFHDGMELGIVQMTQVQSNSAIHWKHCVDSYRDPKWS
jgi:predicted RNA binding protein YcfA (HicA-like mRNA interferase family)